MSARAERTIVDGYGDTWRLIVDDQNERGRILWFKGKPELDADPDGEPPWLTVDQKTARGLVPMLQHFADTGELPEREVSESDHLVIAYLRQRRDSLRASAPLAAGFIEDIANELERGEHAK